MKNGDRIEITSLNSDHGYGDYSFDQIGQKGTIVSILPFGNVHAKIEGHGGPWFYSRECIKVLVPWWKRLIFWK